jgi:hypothetical protein
MPRRKKYYTEEEKKEWARYQREWRNRDRKKYNEWRMSNWRKQDKDKINAYKRSAKAKSTRKIWRRKRYKEDADFKLSETLRGSLSRILKSNKIPKKSKALELLGVKIKYFKKYLEHRFKSGMTWDNHGKVWHLDHIIPVSAIDLSTDANLKFAFHYRNFQPMFAKDNLIKSNNIFIPIEPHIQMWEVDIIVKKILKKLKPDLDLDLDIVDGGILIKVLKKYKKGKLN